MFQVRNFQVWILKMKSSYILNSLITIIPWSEDRSLYMSVSTRTYMCPGKPYLSRPYDHYQHIVKYIVICRMQFRSLDIFLCYTQSIVACSWSNETIYIRYGYALVILTIDKHGPWSEDMQRCVYNNGSSNSRMIQLHKSRHKMYLRDKVCLVVTNVRKFTWEQIEFLSFTFKPLIDALTG